MNKTFYVVAKAVTASSTLFLLIVGSTCVYLALRAIYSITTNPEISLLLAPCLLIFHYFLGGRTALSLLGKAHYLELSANKITVIGDVECCKAPIAPVIAKNKVSLAKIGSGQSPEGLTKWFCRIHPLHVEFDPLHVEFVPWQGGFHGLHDEFYNQLASLRRFFSISAG